MKTFSKNEILKRNAISVLGLFSPSPWGVRRGTLLNWERWISSLIRALNIHLLLQPAGRGWCYAPSHTSRRWWEGIQKPSVLFQIFPFVCKMNCWEHGSACVHVWVKGDFLDTSIWPCEESPLTLADCRRYDSRVGLPCSRLWGPREQADHVFPITPEAHWMFQKLSDYITDKFYIFSLIDHSKNQFILSLCFLCDTALGKIKAMKRLLKLGLIPILWNFWDW